MRAVGRKVHLEPFWIPSRAEANTNPEAKPNQRYLTGPEEGTFDDGWSPDVPTSPAQVLKSSDVENFLECSEASTLKLCENVFAQLTLAKVKSLLFQHQLDGEAHGAAKVSPRFQNLGGTTNTRHV